MKNFYLLDKKEIKEELKKFNKTQVGKALKFQYTIFLIGSFIFEICMLLQILIGIVVNEENEILDILNSIDISIIMICGLLCAVIASVFYTTYLKFFKDYYIKKDS